MEDTTTELRDRKLVLFLSPAEKDHLRREAHRLSAAEKRNVSMNEVVRRRLADVIHSA